LRPQPRSFVATPAIIARELLHRIKRASTLQEGEAAGKAFRAWAEAQGLLLVPPEDGKRA